MAFSKTQKKMNRERLVAFLRKHNLKYRLAGEIFGVSFGAISHWKNGEKAMSAIAVRMLDIYEKYPKVFNEQRREAERRIAEMDSVS